MNGSPAILRVSPGDPHEEQRAKRHKIHRCARAVTQILGFAVFLAVQAPEASRADEGPPSVGPAMDIELARLVDLCAEKLQIKVKYEPAQLSGTVPLVEDRSGLELWTLANAALVSRGLTTIQEPGEAALTVVKLDDAESLARLEDDEPSKSLAGYIKVLHRLTYASPEDVLPTLKKALSGPAGQASALGKTNSIVIADLRSNLGQLFHLLKFLDTAPRSSGTETFRVFSIRNRSALELAELLNRLSGTGYLSPVEPPPGEISSPRAATPGLDSLAARMPAGIPQAGLDASALRADHGRLFVNADEATNTLFASGDAGLIDKIAGLITTLDVMPPQVMLEVLILNLSDSDVLDLGVEFHGISDQGTLVTLSSLFGLGTPNPSSGLQPIPSALGLTGIVLKPGDFSALVSALQVLNKGRALNIPKVLVNSNQRANLASVLQTPFLSTNVANVIATTTFGGTQDAGTTINVRPQIAEGDHLVLEYSIVLSTFVGVATDPSLPPPRQQNNLNSIATIPDGYTVALGGLETNSQTQASSRLPLLGDLPLIGPLFRSDSRVVSHSRFYVFIRASILRSTDFQDLKFISDVDAHRADIDPRWPEVEPVLIR
jgi:type II secretory pathway component GspD/PulD (secretin)